MPTCESCNKTVKDGQPNDHWICEDCRVSTDVTNKEKSNDE